uniref:Uncharacterized protein n=1 Tax=Trypanosoma congolense (strain IL3000) TaxID=1068625 RepID=G0UU12_TRYCI|nr:hypothetical protein, unlikely [Trypanosoma congolense IL3000]
MKRSETKKNRYNKGAGCARGAKPKRFRGRHRSTSGGLFSLAQHKTYLVAANWTGASSLVEAFSRQKEGNGICFARSNYFFQAASTFILSFLSFPPITPCTAPLP